MNTQWTNVEIINLIKTKHKMAHEVCNELPIERKRVVLKIALSLGLEVPNTLSYDYQSQQWVEQD